jgi:diguanylate cyclase (GGDEF)-like protein
MSEPLIDSPPDMDPSSVGFNLVLGQSREVKKRIAACSVDLDSANRLVMWNLAELSTLLSAQKLMFDSDEIKERVAECADDLDIVNAALVQGIDCLKHTEDSLSDALEVLARTQTTLAAVEGERNNFESLALHDATTGLPNRRLFGDRLAQALMAAERHHRTLAVMFLDLDDFKGINDAHGHGAGDEVLKEVARRLLLHTRREDTACRSGGDEFLLLLMDPQGPKNIARIGAAISNNIAAPIDTGRRGVSVTASIGISIYPENGTTTDELIRNADSAMYKAKEMKCRYVFC